MNPVWDGRNMPRKQENSAKSGEEVWRVCSWQGWNHLKLTQLCCMHRLSILYKVSAQHSICLTNSYAANCSDVVGSSTFFHCDRHRIFARQAFLVFYDQLENVWTDAQLWCCRNGSVGILDRRSNVSAATKHRQNSTLDVVMTSATVQQVAWEFCTI